MHLHSHEGPKSARVSRMIFDFSCFLFTPKKNRVQNGENQLSNKNYERVEVVEVIKIRFDLINILEERPRRGSIYRTNSNCTFEFFSSARLARVWNNKKKRANRTAWKYF
jgi:hypothetical protein